MCEWLSSARARSASSRSSREGMSALHLEQLQAVASASALEGGVRPKGLRFTDKDEHMYFWFPLLAGLSELTFDPRIDIRCSTAPAHFWTHTS